MLSRVVLYGALCTLCVYAAKYPADLPQCQSMPNSIDINQGANSPINIDLYLKNLDLNGISKAVITKVVGFQEDVLNSKFEIYATLPRLSLKCDDKIDGRVLVLPITGTGKSSLDFEDSRICIKYKPKIMVKNGKEYIQTDKFKMEFDAGKFSLHFTNLFNGDKALGDNMNVFLNENWRDILNELKPSITSALEQILEAIINRILLVIR